MRTWALRDWFPEKLAGFQRSYSLQIMEQRTCGQGQPGHSPHIFRSGSFLCDGSSLEQPKQGEGFPEKDKIVRKCLFHVGGGLWNEE